MTDINLSILTPSGLQLPNAVLCCSAPSIDSDGKATIHYCAYASPELAAEGTKKGIIAHEEVEHVIPAEVLDLGKLAELGGRVVGELQQKVVRGTPEKPLEETDNLMRIALPADKLKEISGSDQRWDDGWHPVEVASHAIFGDVPSGKPKGAPVEQGTLTLDVSDLHAEYTARVQARLLASLAEVADPHAADEPYKKLSHRWQVATKSKKSK